MGWAGAGRCKQCRCGVCDTLSERPAYKKQRFLLDSQRHPQANLDLQPAPYQELQWCTPAGFIACRQEAWPERALTCRGARGAGAHASMHAARLLHQPPTLHSQQYRMSLYAMGCTACPGLTGGGMHSRTVPGLPMMAVAGRGWGGGAHKCMPQNATDIEFCSIRMFFHHPCWMLHTVAFETCTSDMPPKPCWGSHAP